MMEICPHLWRYSDCTAELMNRRNIDLFTLLHTNKDIIAVDYLIGYAADQIAIVD